MDAPVDPVTGFRNVLLCVLAERGATAAVRRLLGVMPRGATLTIAEVIPEPSLLEQLLHGAEQVEELLQSGHRDAERRVERLLRAVERAGDDVEVTSVIDVGHGALSLVTRAIAAEHDLLAVVVGEDGDGALVRRLIRKSPCPVWVLRPTRAARPRVVAAIDPEPEQESLNGAVMAAAEAVAGVDGVLCVVNAWEMYGESTMRSSAFVHVEPEEIERRREAVREAHERAVRDLVDGRPDPGRWEVEVRPGPAAAVVDEVIDRHHATTLVLGTVGRSGLSGLVMGNTAEKLVDRVGCSVLAVKPPGFASPIRL